MDFIWYLTAVFLVSLLWFLVVALKIWRRKKSVTARNIAEALLEVKDDPKEPARWVP
jgi:hypothetical protein